MNHTAPAQGYFPHESGVEEVEAPEPSPETLRVPAPPEGCNPAQVFNAILIGTQDQDDNDTWFDY